MTPRTFADELLIIGLIDHLDASYAYTVVAPEEPEATVFSDCRAGAIGLLTVLLVEGAIEPIVEDGDAWTGASRPTGEVVLDLTRGWLKEWPDDVPTPGALGWFRLTSLGEDLAKSRLELEDH